MAGGSSTSRIARIAANGTAGTCQEPMTFSGPPFAVRRMEGLFRLLDNREWWSVVSRKEPFKNNFGKW